MNELRFTLLTDGSSDRVLLRHLGWILRELLSLRVAVQPQWADLRSLRKKPESFTERIRMALDLYPCDLLFVHRDSEKPDPSPRYAEIEQAVVESRISTPAIPVVPIRMTEAWLLFDERAVRTAAGNPHGRMWLDLPVSNAEAIADPKTLLHDALKQASALAGRRLRRFRTSDAVHRVAEYIEDFSPLQELTAFRSLCERVREVVRSQGWPNSSLSSTDDVTE
jgi:hypothetical protein